MPIPYYRCAKCKKEYEEFEGAEECERSHAKVELAKPRQYTVSPYPYTLDVAFSDGSSKVYVLDELASTYR